jgi:hypothetical protein
LGETVITGYLACAFIPRWARGLIGLRLVWEPWGLSESNIVCYLKWLSDNRTHTLKYELLRFFANENILSVPFAAVGCVHRWCRRGSGYDAATRPPHAGTPRWDDRSFALAGCTVF